MEISIILRMLWALRQHSFQTNYLVNLGFLKRTCQNGQAFWIYLLKNIRNIFLPKKFD